MDSPFVKIHDLGITIEMTQLQTIEKHIDPNSRLTFIQPDSQSRITVRAIPTIHP